MRLCNPTRPRVLNPQEKGKKEEKEETSIRKRATVGSITILMNIVWNRGTAAPVHSVIIEMRGREEESEEWTCAAAHTHEIILRYRSRIHD